MSSAAARVDDPEIVEAAYRLELVNADKQYARDPWAWLTEQVWTVDEASQRRVRWPRDKMLQRELLAAIEHEPMIAIPKSRRMMVTWLVAAFVLHRCRYYANNAVYWQSLTEDVAAEAVNNRIAFMEQTLDQAPLRRKFSAIRTAKGLIGKMTYIATGSTITAIPEGADKIRSRTPSILVMDESEFQPQAPLALTAAMATVEKQAKLIVISSSNGPRGVLAELCRGIGFTRFA